jgi:NADH dehydrogenase FAD-containing subunit
LLTTTFHQIQTRGPTPNTAFVAESLGAAALSDRDLIRVRETLQLQDHDNIFAAGDVIEWKEQKQAAKASPEGALAGANVLAYLNGGKMKPYKGAFEMIVATNGKVCVFSLQMRVLVMSRFADGWFRVVGLRMWMCGGGFCLAIGSRE